MAKFHILFIVILMFEDCLTRHIKLRKKLYKTPNGLLCQMCPVGTFLLRPCEDNYGESMCSVCPRGTFTDTANSATGCEECTVCRIKQRQTSPCTGTSDRVCECPEGFYWATYFGYDGVCLHHTVCNEDEVVAVKGTSTSNTICKKAPPTTTLRTLLTTPASKNDAGATVKVLDVQNTNQNNSTDTELYSVIKLGRKHHHKRLSHHVDVDKIWKPKHIPQNPSANITETSTESHKRQIADTLVNTPSNDNIVNAPVNETVESAPPSEIAANTPSNETAEIAAVIEISTNAAANETNSYKSPIENGKTLSTIHVPVLQNGITQKPQTQATPKHSKTLSGGRRRKRKRKGKGKKARRRRKKNKNKKKHRRIKKCQHKDLKKRQKCERRKLRHMHRKKKSKKVSIL